MRKGKISFKKGIEVPVYSSSIAKVRADHHSKGPDIIRSEDEPFSHLPKHRRPAPLQTYSEDVDAISDESFVRPDPIPEPDIISRFQGSEAFQSVTISKSTVVPSYMLAMSNAWTTARIKDLKSRSVPSPLFVYGSLMFPSILRAVAAKYVSKQGTYCRQVQRRLRTSEEDWSSINSSVQNAAQQMTPALLKGYQRFEDQGGGDAQIFRTQEMRPSTSHH